MDALLSRTDQAVPLSRTKVPFQPEQHEEYRADDQYLLNAAALDARSDDQQPEEEQQDRARRDDEDPAPVHPG